jgi:hypothetical protein
LSPMGILRVQRTGVVEKSRRLNGDKGGMSPSGVLIKKCHPVF